MKHNQGKSMSGFITIEVQGERPEAFFQLCSQSGVQAWDIRKPQADICEGSIKLKDVQRIKPIKRGTGYKVRFKERKGLPFLFKHFLGRKTLVTGLLAGLLFLLFLSNILWDVEISGLPKDVEEKVNKQLDEYGIQQGAWIFKLESPNQIQQQLIKDVPELLWVGVDQRGTTFHLEGVEKIVVKEEEKPGPQNLVAAKKGVITDMYVAKGRPLVHVSDYVDAGDVLVSGRIDSSAEEEEEQEKERKAELVAAQGEVTAATWYEVSVTVPLELLSEQLTGNRKKKYHLKAGQTMLPVWGFGSHEFDEVYREVEERSLYFLKWELPVKFVETTLSEKQSIQEERTKDEAVEAGVLQAKKDLQLHLGPDATIVSEKILQETMDNGKVKINLFLSVEENIAEAEPIKTTGQTE
ncbi:sporulation protein YqfD [Virgibacillus xinjiangensis]|uniref:Sporulation protein YqfD n=1 Tax=Virgibacillus xinjiangensis TaxID=393090 RepID=A0ABV7CRQ1_9BACI